jgi:hypothetical protein
MREVTNDDQVEALSARLRVGGARAVNGSNPLGPRFGQLSGRMSQADRPLAGCFRQRSGEMM